MIRNKYQGLFIVIDGLDGSGLSTQANLLTKALRGGGNDVYMTKEPTNNVIGGLIRGFLSGVYELRPEAAQLLFAADRSHHLSREIIPMLEGGNTVVCDRYAWSTIAFGSIDIDRNWLIEINRYAILPDVSIFLGVPPKICIKRIVEDRYDFELFEKVRELTKVWRTYRWLARNFKKDVVVVNGVGAVGDVHERIIRALLTNSKAKRILNKVVTK